MRLIIFDVDGTLVDSQHAIIEAQTRAFVSCGLPAPTRERALSVVGLSLHEAFAILAGREGPIERLSKAYIAAWTDIRLRPGCKDVLYPGAADTVVALSRAPRTSLGLATGKSRRGVDRILAAQGWTDLFATIQTADAHPSKPDPSMLHAAMAETGASAAETLMIGDTTYDMEMASAAGVRAIGVAWGYHEAADLTAAKAVAIAGDFEALRAILDACATEVA